MSKSIRLTVGQALVRFVAKQYVERDGRQNRFIEGFWGIFGHGNVSGLGQGIVESAEEEGLRFYRPQHEQGMVHISRHSLNTAIGSQPLRAQPPLGLVRSTWLQ